MFTGIVEERGTVLETGAFRLVVGCHTVVSDSEIGASVAVNGVCLTVVARGRRGPVVRPVGGDARQVDASAGWAEGIR